MQEIYFLGAKHICCFMVGGIGGVLEKSYLKLGSDKRLSYLKKWENYTIDILKFVE